MKPEVEFVKKIEAFLDQEFNDYSTKRIITYLNEYKDRIPPVYIHKTIEKNTVAKRPINTTKTFASDEDLINQAKAFCDQNDIDFKRFATSKSIKSTCDISAARKKFCQYMYEIYLCNNTQLARFFNVDHSTISFYLYGKKSRTKI